MNEVIQQVPDTFHGMFIGYTVFWVAIAAYVIKLAIRVKKLEQK